MTLPLSSVGGSRRSAPPGSLLFSVWVGWRQPERDMARLHRLPDHRHQMPPQLLQVHFIGQGGPKLRQRPSRIILAAVEATIDDGLNAMAQGLEESSNDEGRD